MKIDNKARADAALAAAVGGYFVYQLIASMRYPAEAALFPRIVGVLGVLFAIFIIASALRGRSASHYKDEHLDRRGLSLAIGAPIAYGLALWLFGYWLSTLVALIAFPLMIGFGHRMLVVVTAIATTVLFGVLLHYMQVRLPMGVLLAPLVGG